MEWRPRVASRGRAFPKSPAPHPCLPGRARRKPLPLATVRDMSEQPATTDDDTYEPPPPDALPVGTGITGIEPQPDDGPQPDQNPHYEDEDPAAIVSAVKRYGARVGATNTLTATRVLNEARSHLGFREGRSNDNPFWKWPPYYSWLRFASYCASAMSYCFYQVGGTAGLAAIHGGHYNCAEWRGSAQRFGQWHTVGQPGDLVLFDWSGTKRNPEHVGILESSTGGTVTCIEFNTSSGNAGSQSNGGGCYRRTRNKRYVVGYVRPSYGAAVVVVVPTKNPTNTGTKKIVLTVDGDWGANTTRRLQQFMGIPVDGDIGPATRKALQRLVGVTADGAWGPATRKALQRLVKVQQDGAWGPNTTRAFQRYLNAQGLRRRVTTTFPGGTTGLMAAVVAWLRGLFGQRQP